MTNPNSRLIPYDKDAICDWCGAQGAYDFMGDFYCENCATSAFDTDDLEEDNEE